MPRVQIREEPDAQHEVRRRLIGLRAEDALHLVFSKTGFDERVRAWAANAHARLLTPADLLAPL